jgi:4-hydroxy-3-polyprenylbenzoate decarboxylase
MAYKSLQQCISDLEKKGELLQITKETDPNLEMASLHLDEFAKAGKAILFENIKGSKFQAVSNLFGNIERSKFIFRDTLEKVKQLIDLKTNPSAALKSPAKAIFAALHAIYAIPLKVRFPRNFYEIQIEDIPQVKCWKEDGGAFITLPQVYSEDIENPGIMNSNLGMYRIQLSGNDYISNKEIGMHYQIHRGIGVHQKNANQNG